MATVPAILECAEAALSKRPKNPADLYLFALGWFAERLRKETTELSQEQVGDHIGVSQSGYGYLASGSSTNLDRWWKLYEFYGVDVITALGHCRVIVRAIQEEEAAQGRALTKQEKIDIGYEYYSKLPF